MEDAGREDWDDDEPPMLGEADGHDEDNQVAERAEDESLMDEMVAIAQTAKEAKRKEQEKERNRKSFGQGLKKGFFNTSAAKKKTADAAKRLSSTSQQPGRKQTREERLLIVKQQEEKTEPADSTFVFPEVQEALQSVNQLNPNGLDQALQSPSRLSARWMNERFFEKLSRNPKLAQALQNPAFTQAIAEMQQDPRAAVLKYQKDPAVSTMLQDFMAFLGSHFEEVKAHMGEAEAQKTPSQPQQSDGHQGERKLQPLAESAASSAQKPPAIVDLDAKRREAIANMQRTPEEEAQVQRILQNPELMTALSDEKLMQQLHACQQAPEQLQRLARDPVLGPKLRLLAQHKLVTFAS
ncbi:hypothetical protein BBJ28_00007905 [Nothophytophthora sp. Chile5]|nr:hypothetical protein BBJ28_00007905 [Nothophytophthora sp. Chile5]